MLITVLPYSLGDTSKLFQKISVIMTLDLRDMDVLCLWGPGVIMSVSKGLKSYAHALTLLGKDRQQTR